MPEYRNFEWDKDEMRKIERFHNNNKQRCRWMAALKKRTARGYKRIIKKYNHNISCTILTLCLMYEWSGRESMWFKERPDYEMHGTREKDEKGEQQIFLLKIETKMKMKLKNLLVYVCPVECVCLFHYYISIEVWLTVGIVFRCICVDQMRARISQSTILFKNKIVFHFFFSLYFWTVLRLLRTMNFSLLLWGTEHWTSIKDHFHVWWCVFFIPLLV